MRWGIRLITKLKQSSSSNDDAFSNSHGGLTPFFPSHVFPFQILILCFCGVFQQAIFFLNISDIHIYTFIYLWKYILIFKITYSCFQFSTDNIHNCALTPSYVDMSVSLDSQPPGPTRYTNYAIQQVHCNELYRSILQYNALYWIVWYDTDI